MVQKRMKELGEAQRWALVVEQGDRALALSQWREALGKKPQGRLAWVLDFAYGKDPSEMSAQERAAIRHGLTLVVHDATEGRWTVRPADREVYERITPQDSRTKRAPLPKSLRLDLERARDTGFPLTVERSRAKVSAEELQGPQRAVREAIETLVSGHQYGRPFAEAPQRYARLGPAQIPSPPIPRRRFVVVSLLIASLADAVVQAALDLLAKTPPAAVRRCEPAPKFRIRCGRVFVGERRQKYCAEHREVIRQAQVQAALEKFHKKPRARKTAPRRKGGRSR